METQLDRVERKIERVEGKLDQHIARIAKLEEAMSWVRGHVNIVTLVVLAVVSAVVAKII